MSKKETADTAKKVVRVGFDEHQHHQMEEYQKLFKFVHGTKPSKASIVIDVFTGKISDLKKATEALKAAI